MIPEEIGAWVAEGAALRAKQRQAGVPIGKRRPLLLQALNRIYEGRAEVSA